ncbi:MAG: hypothetical protein JNM93_13750, partial [Bacteriovoracaceae bacterium]|nr:hypothetical protein [Bacteriovoracaceae bacterium]
RWASSIDDYKKNLRFEGEVLKKRCAKVMFISTTSFSPTYEHAFDHEAVERNQAAKEVMTELGIKYCDVYELSKSLVRPDNLHFDEASSVKLALRIKQCELLEFQ